MAAKQNRNTISTLTNSEGNNISSLPQIEVEVVRFFQKLLGTEDDKVSGCSLPILSELLGKSSPQ